MGPHPCAKNAHEWGTRYINYSQARRPDARGSRGIRTYCTVRFTVAEAVIGPEVPVIVIA
jgi:hypothetical protein